MRDTRGSILLVAKSTVERSTKYQLELVLVLAQSRMEQVRWASRY